jgi:hypothetical protein
VVTDRLELNHGVELRTERHSVVCCNIHRERTVIDVASSLQSEGDSVYSYTLQETLETRVAGNAVLPVLHGSYQETPPITLQTDGRKSTLH